jgi:hypothetical protein
VGRSRFQYDRAVLRAVFGVSEGGISWMALERWRDYRCYAVNFNMGCWLSWRVNFLD